MTALFGIGESIAVLAIGILIRLALLVLFVLAMAVPVLLALWLFDQALAARRRVLGLSAVAGLPWRHGLLHAPGHLWLRPRGRRLRLGLDGLAQHLLPEVDGIRVLHEEGAVRRGEPIAEICCGRRRVAVASPVDGELHRINGALRWWPWLIKRDPYVRGWIAEVEPSDEDGSAFAFVEGASARRWFEDESSRLRRFFEGRLGLAAADGGEVIGGPVAALSDEDWRQATREFLRAA